MVGWSLVMVVMLSFEKPLHHMVQVLTTYKIEKKGHCLSNNDQISDVTLMFRLPAIATLISREKLQLQSNEAILLAVSQKGRIPMMNDLEE